MKKIFSLMLMLTTFVGISMAQIMNPVHWTVSDNVEGKVLTITYSARIDDHFHLYSTQLPEGGPEKTAFVLALPEVEVVKENGSDVKLRTIGDKWSYLQRTKFGANAQPFYVLLDNNGKPLNSSYSYNEDVEAYVQFLNTGLKNYNK